MIQFFTEDIEFELSNGEQITDWIAQVVYREKYEIESLNYIFCRDDYLHHLNVQHLNHDTLTDIITFPYHNADDVVIQSDIFISIERVRENAEKFEVSFERELHRVIIHGALHLCGFKDKTEEEAKNMRRKEDEALMLLTQL